MDARVILVHPINRVCDTCGTTIAAGTAMQGDEHGVQCLGHPVDPWPDYRRRVIQGHELTRSSHSSP